MSSNSDRLSEKQKETRFDMPGNDSRESQPGSQERHHRNYTVSQVLAPPYMKLGNPGPLGLLGFAVTTFVLGLYECGAG